MSAEGSQTPPSGSADLDSETRQGLLLRPLSGLDRPGGAGGIRETEEKYNLVVGCKRILSNYMSLLFFSVLGE